MSSYLPIFGTLASSLESALAVNLDNKLYSLTNLDTLAIAISPLVSSVTSMNIGVTLRLSDGSCSYAHILEVTQSFKSVMFSCFILNQMTWPDFLEQVPNGMVIRGIQLVTDSIGVPLVLGPYSLSFQTWLETNFNYETSSPLDWSTSTGPTITKTTPDTSDTILAPGSWHLPEVY